MPWRSTFAGGCPEEKRCNVDAEEEEGDIIEAFFASKLKWLAREFQPARTRAFVGLAVSGSLSGEVQEKRPKPGRQTPIQAVHWPMAVMTVRQVNRAISKSIAQSIAVGRRSLQTVCTSFLREFLMPKDTSASGERQMAVPDCRRGREKGRIGACGS